MKEPTEITMTLPTNLAKSIIELLGSLPTNSHAYPTLIEFTRLANEGLQAINEQPEENVVQMQAAE